MCFEVFIVFYVSMVYDFIIIDEYVIFLIFLVMIDVEWIMNGGLIIVWDLKVLIMIGIMGWNDSMDIICWFEGEFCYVYYLMNVYMIYENGKIKVVVDLVKYFCVFFFLDVDGSCLLVDLSVE